MTRHIVVVKSHGVKCGIRVAMALIGVVGRNTLKLALSTTKRSWSTKHTVDIAGKVDECRNTLLYAERDMSELGKAIDHMKRLRLSERQVMEYIDALFPLYDNPTPQQQKNLNRMKEDMKTRYFDAPDLKHVGKNGYRFINAVSDFATHARPLRESANHTENPFAKTVEGNALIDRAFAMLQAA